MLGSHRQLATEPNYGVDPALREAGRSNVCAVLDAEDGCFGRAAADGGDELLYVDGAAVCDAEAGRAPHEYWGGGGVGVV